MYKFPFNTAGGFKYAAGHSQGKLHPALYSGSFSVGKTADTYLDMQGFGKGFVFVNGHNLGKYWNIGPQQTIYLPGCWLKKGVNEITVFDELKGGHASINTLDHPILNEVVKE
jgi:beta-galactosidase